MLGVYALADMSSLARLEWRDGKLTLIDVSDPADRVPIDRGPEPGSFVVAPGYRQSGEPVDFRRRPDGAVVALLLGGGSMVRLDPVA